MNNLFCNFLLCASVKYNAIACYRFRLIDHWSVLRGAGPLTFGRSMQWMFLATVALVMCNLPWWLIALIALMCGLDKGLTAVFVCMVCCLFHLVECTNVSLQIDAYVFRRWATLMGGLYACVMMKLMQSVRSSVCLNALIGWTLAMASGGVYKCNYCSAVNLSILLRYIWRKSSPFSLTCGTALSGPSS